LKLGGLSGRAATTIGTGPARPDPTVWRIGVGV